MFVNQGLLALPMLGQTQQLQARARLPSCRQPWRRVRGRARGTRTAGKVRSPGRASVAPCTCACGHAVLGVLVVQVDLAHPSWAPATNAASSRSMAASSRRRLGEPRVGSSVPSRLGAPRQALPRPPCPACRVSSRCSCCPLGPCLPCGACARCRGAAQVLFAGRSPQFGAERLDSSPPSSWCGA